MSWPISAISLLLTPGKEADIRRSTRGSSNCASQRKRLCGKIGQHVARRKFEKEPGSTFIQIGGEVVPAHRIGYIGCQLAPYLLGGPQRACATIAKIEQARCLKLDASQRLRQAVGHWLHQRTM